jgi:ubiquinone biosynthesis protein
VLWITETRDSLIRDATPSFEAISRIGSGPVITKGERYREILAALARQGIGIVEDELIKHEAGDQARAEHLRRACEELGTTFTKLGQVLSTRSDLLPEVYRAELAKLQSNVPPLPECVIGDVIEEDLEAPPHKIFAFFDQTPLGSASIGQAHAARLFDGREVVVKVRKPGVVELVEADLEILAGLVEAWSPRFPMLEEYDAVTPCGLNWTTPAKRPT